VRLRGAGRLADAAAACRRILERAPGDARAWCELAHALRWLGELDDARAAAHRALQEDPGLARAWFNLGAVEVAQGKGAAGIEAYRRALALEPGLAETWSNLGDALGAAGDKAGEIAAYQRAAAANPALAPVWSNLGRASLEAGRIGAALHACRRAVALDPEFAPGWNNLGNALRESGEHEEAVAACEAALRIAPALAEAWSSLGAAQHALARYDEAIAAHQHAAKLQPGAAHHHLNLGIALQHHGRGPESIAALRRALALEPEHADAHWFLGYALLAAGELFEGWAEYEWRWRRSGAEPKRHDFAAWDGDVSKPRRLLVWGEQGIGDQVIYASMVPDLAATPLRVTLEVDERLVTLYRRSFPGVNVIAATEPVAATPAQYDCQVPLGSLGQWLRREFTDFPSRACLVPDAARAGTYRARLAGARATPLVGVSWKSANAEFGSLKSSALSDWTPLLRQRGACFVDLQYGDTAGERARLEAQAGASLVHLAELDLYHDLEGLAALCAACDLVITASNVTAHIAGAVGRPVWLLLPGARGRIWYWFAGRETSPWYPALRVFEQSSPGRWDDVMERVAGELAALLARRDS
jgi:tetratricopeptide (TPR) repeat protein